MKRVLIPLLILALCVGVAAFAEYMGLNFWFSLATAITCFLLNGLLATLEDDLPGGHNNPDGASTPAYVSYVVWSVRVVGVLALCGIAVSLSMLKFH